MNDPIEKPAGTPDAEGVKALLENREAPPSTEETSVPINLDGAAQQDLLGDAAPPPDAAQKERIETPVDPTFDPKLPNNGNLMVWALKTSDIGTVEVSDNEKDLYIKAAMNDAEVRFNVEFTMGSTKATVQLRTLSNYELDVMFAALAGDEASGRIKDPAQYTSLLQQYAAAMQVISLNANPFETISFEPSALAKLKEDSDKLREQAQLLVGKSNFVRWNVLLTALRIFSIKIKICNDALANQDFWKPADID